MLCKTQQARSLPQGPYNLKFVMDQVIEEETKETLNRRRTRTHFSYIYLGLLSVWVRMEDFVLKTLQKKKSFEEEFQRHPTVATTVKYFHVTILAEADKSSYCKQGQGSRALFQSSLYIVKQKQRVAL